MVNAKTRGGVHVSGAVGAERDTNPSADVLKLIRTQNKGYLETKLAHERNNVERLKQGLHFIGAGKGTHTVFVDDEEQAEAFDPVEYFDTVPKLVDAAHNRLRRDQLKTLELGLGKDVVAAASERAYGKLSHGLARTQALQASVDHLDQKRHLMGKGKRVKVREAEGDRPAVFKWKNERKR
jgi:U3 small nucleolar RNA-associated protein 11